MATHSHSMPRAEARETAAALRALAAETEARASEYRAMADSLDPPAPAAARKRKPIPLHVAMQGSVFTAAVPAAARP